MRIEADIDLMPGWAMVQETKWTIVYPSMEPDVVLGQQVVFNARELVLAGRHFHSVVVATTASILTVSKL